MNFHSIEERGVHDLGIDYSLVICMAEDYRPTLETVEGIIRIFDKHGLKTARYPTEDRSKILLSKGTIEKGIARLREGSKISAPCPKCGLKEMVSSVDSQNTPRYSEFFIRCKKCNYEFKVEKKEDVALYIEERAALIKVIEKEGVKPL